MKFSVFQLSRRGGRDKNEDRMGYCYTSRAALFVLADGMGGHPEGEVAAQLAIQTIATQFQSQARSDLPDASLFLSNAVMAAHRQILRYSLERSMLDAPRTTIVAAVIQRGALTWTHCGDSRLYLVRQGELLTRTRDHSLMEQSLAKGAPADAHINRNVLFTCLGSPTKPVYSVFGPVGLQYGDRVMLCSDGLWSSLTEQAIVADLSRKPVHQAVPDLVEKALRLGGVACDNVTCLALAWETPDAYPSDDASIHTDSLQTGVFASTVQGNWPEDAADTEHAAIERSIAEIEAAMHRTGANKSAD